MAILGTEERACCGEVAVMGRLGCNMMIFFREYNIFIVLEFMLAGSMSYNGNPIIYNTCV